MAPKIASWPLEVEAGSHAEVLTSVLARTGYVFPALVLFVLYLAIKYPNRVVGTKSLKGREMLYEPAGGVPILGHTLAIKKLIGTDPLNQFLALARKSSINSFTVSFLGLGRLIVLNDPAYVQYIQSTNFENFPKGPKVRERLGTLLGETGIFVADGAVWHAQRKKASLMFSSRQFREWVSTCVHMELDDAVGLLDNVPAGEGKLDFPQLLFRFTLSGFAKMAFDADLHCLSKDPASLHTPVPFAAAFDDVQTRLGQRFTKLGWQITEKFSQSGRNLRANVETIHSLAKGIIVKRLKEHAASKADYSAEEKIDMRAEGEKSAKESLKKDGKDLLGFFMEMTDSPDELLVVVLNFIIAGRDTTAQGLSWLFYELCANPIWIEHIREEVLEAGIKTASDGSYRLEYEELSKLPLTLAVWSETLRLHPPVPRATKRTVVDDVIIPQGPNPNNLPPIPVKAGETVAWSDYVHARTPAVWGEDCEQFKPERFIGTDEVTGKRSFIQHGQWRYHVFNGGPRLCLGMNLANFEALAFVAAIVPRFDFEWATKAEGQTSPWPPTYGISLTHPVRDPYVLKFKKRAA